MNALNELFSEIVQRGTPLVGQPETETVALVGFGQWHELEHTIKPRLFGEMLRRATPVVQNYHGDLYHDSLFVCGLTGPTSFDYYVRENGTNFGLTARLMADAYRPDNGVLYNVRLHTDDRGEWFATFTRLPRTQKGA